MNVGMTFGSFLKSERLKAGFGLRSFAKEIGLQPSNLSNMEHGRLKPIQDLETLKTITEVLGYEKDSEKWKMLFDLSTKENHKALAPDIIEFLEGNEAIPTFFREIKDKKLTEADLRNLTEYIRAHYSK